MDKAIGALDVCLDDLCGLANGNDLVNFAYFDAQCLSVDSGECVAGKADNLKKRNAFDVWC